VAASATQSANAQRKVIEWGEAAAQQEGAACTELESKRVEVEAQKEKVKQAVQKEQLSQDARMKAQVELEAKENELHSVRQELSSFRKDLEACRAREADLLRRNEAQVRTTEHLTQELDEIRSLVAKSDVERLASERCAREAAEIAGGEREWLLSEIERYGVLAEGTRKLQVEIEQYKTEALERHRLEEELSRLRATTVDGREKEAAERKRIEAELEQMRQAAIEKLRLEVDLKHIMTKSDENEKARLEDQKAIQETHRQLDKERQQQVEQERAAGMLEGKVSALSSHAANQTQKVSELNDELSRDQDRCEKLTKDLNDTAAAKQRKIEASEQKVQECEAARRDLARIQEELTAKEQQACCAVQ